MGKIAYKTHPPLFFLFLYSLVLGKGPLPKYYNMTNIVMEVIYQILIKIDIFQNSLPIANTQSPKSRQYWPVYAIKTPFGRLAAHNAAKRRIRTRVISGERKVSANCRGLLSSH